METAAAPTVSPAAPDDAEGGDKGTLSLSIRCNTCKLPFTPRLAFGRKAWVQRSGDTDKGERVAVHLCGDCVSGFSSVDAALDFLDGVLEHQLGAAPVEAPPAA